jgi:hypothetical protein
MAWRVAKSLETLRNQVNAAYPNRSKASDGILGDTRHQAVASDHNPNSAGVVTAMDITHHAGYFDAHALADTLIKNRHPNLKYVISNSRIAGAWTNWQWQKYSGPNPHSKHIHVSVGVGTDGKSVQPYDDTKLWTIKPTSTPTTQPKEEVMNKGDVTNMYRILLGREPDAGGLATYIGMPWSKVFYSIKDSAEAKTRASQIANAEAAEDKLIKDLQTALTNEKNKPPKEVIKTVEKVVEKVVEKRVEVPVEVNKPHTWDSVVSFIKEQFNKLRRK